ncbi:membrane protein [Dyella jiangningensis]|nr:membrane protein [Dyella jiangningensis]
MNRDQLLKELAVTGYNVLYAAKKHFATYDIVEKAPGWITIATLGIGIFALVIPGLTNEKLAAAVLVVGIASIYFNQFQQQSEKYAKAGGELIRQFNELRGIYSHAQSRAADSSVDDLEAQYKGVLAQSEQVWLHKHIFLSDWYAHYKIFWQAQISWLDEQLHFRFWRDKVPLTLSMTLVLTCLAAGYWAVLEVIKLVGSLGSAG